MPDAARAEGPLVLTLFARDPALAAAADDAGIDRIGPDLERIGKAERQGHLDTWVSDHREGDLPILRDRLVRASLFARLNPIHPGSLREIDRTIAAGARVLMLPFFAGADEVRRFVDAVAGRALAVLLLETAAAAERVDAILTVPGIDEVHVGLNDLRLSLGIANHFQLLAAPLLERLAAAVRGAGLPFGVGGVARLGDRRLPVDPDLVLAQYPRLGATRALVSRALLQPDWRALDLAGDIARIRLRVAEWESASPGEWAKARDRLAALADGLSLPLEQDRLRSHRPEA